MPAQQQAVNVGCYFMTTIITIDRLNLYNAYGGDIDGFSRTNSKKNKEVFGDDSDNAWATISSKLQDIALISKRLASQTYTDKTLQELKEICDIQSFAALTSKIKFYANFQIVAEILQELKSKVNIDTDTIWAGFDSVDIFLKELSQDIENIKLCNFTTLDKVNIEFAVTSTYQELSISNGWGDEYLKLAEKFDKVYEEIMTQKTIETNEKPWWKFW
jgi:hypothetical protein